MKQYVIFGASGGIGLALCEEVLKQNQAVVAVTRQPCARLQILASSYPDRCQIRVLSVLEDPIVPAWQTLLPDTADVVISTLGVLHDENTLMRPEKNITQMEAAHFEHSMQVNVFGSARIAQWLSQTQSKDHEFTFVVLSAKLASISDNRLGGWYSYRMSKAALNMLVKTLSVEWQWRFPKGRVLSIHPGTTLTSLSEPFVADKHPVYPLSLTAHRILRVIHTEPPHASGAYLNWDGQVLPY